MLNRWCLSKFLLRAFQLYRGGQCTYLCFHGVRLTSTSPNILSKPQTAFQTPLSKQYTAVREK